MPLPLNFRKRLVNREAGAQTMVLLDWGVVQAAGTFTQLGHL